MEIFRQLGSLVESNWRAANYAEAEFPQIAANALRQLDIAKSGISPWDIVRWVHTEAQLPRQPDLDAAFGNPPITLYCGSRFYVDVYFWLDGTTDIHQHGFAGAFQVFTGSSIHCRYRFLQDRAINENFLIGRTILDDVELLSEGEIREIVPGREQVHSLFHLDRPSCTITVRTFKVPTKQPQYSYRQPYIAIDPTYKDPALVRKLQTVAMLLNLQQKEHDGLIDQLLSTADFETTFQVLQLAFGMLRGSQIESVFQLSTSRDRFDKLVTTARQRHGDLLDYLLPVLAEEDRQRNLISRRQFITSNEHRFFLALLLNIKSCPKVLALVGERYPESDPVEKVLDWVLELSTTKVWGSADANLLGLNEFDDDYLFVLECLLRDLSAAEIGDAAAKNYPADHAAALVERFEQIARALRASICFSGMLAERDGPGEEPARVSKAAIVV